MWNSLAERQFLAAPPELLPVMDSERISARWSTSREDLAKGFEMRIAKYDKAHPGRFYTLPSLLQRFLEPSYPQATGPGDAQMLMPGGARGLKILKTLGLFLRENITVGQAR